ncbi:MAG: glycoside hydrolase family 3 N-terminal domain-containing protein [Candidatus Neomarinimicrobiota bacterium]|jgi:beta-glucosidase|nr:beta-glucosidase [Candidatus Neomarinimicrobiota bacterium]MEC8689245.1 glycoside hydrolase family 3 N-terminal domain-containing protein [Candidatus Neomarinimicrobiota bacterium]MEC8705708.1 glycoside hydrolase family 3 N-terminal domain-containing protein [Candidatus Neomarinimicrobiota bacterium]|tara:strand:+ start:2296 stop:4116 length:1821 start_codon:yes stop_codon:yes gene_type:complete
MTKNIFKITISLFTLVLFGCSDAKTEKLIADTEFVETLMSDMTLKEKIGQMTQVDRQFLNDISDISKYGFGSLLSGGGSTPATNEPKAWADMYDSYQREALKTRLQIPLIYGIDAVHGHNNVVGATIFPHNIGLGATRDAALVEAVARATALEVAATGMDWDFAPCLAVPDDYRWGRTYEGFSEDTDLVSQLGGAAVRGYQSTDISNPQSVLACAKHFIGDGGTTFGTGLNNLIDRGNLAISEEELRKRHLPPFQKAIDEGVATFMAAYNTWNDVKCHANKFLLTDLLKDELGFKGFVVSDWAAIEEIPGDYKSDIITSINAGIDMVMVPGAVKFGNESFENFLKLLEESVQEGSIPMERIDDAVKRILLIKKQSGLFDRPFSDQQLLAHIGSDKHRQIAREAVRKSMVLLKNKDGILPLPKEGKTIIVAGRGADNIGMQSGGWTISWQGDMGQTTDGTTILDAIKSAVSPGTVVEYTPDGTAYTGDLAVVVVGEKPYAEMQGDRKDLKLDKEDLDVIKRFKENDIPVVVVLLSGRPMIITDEIEKWDGLIAAWLPGTEGSGVADVLFGDYNPTGKLSFSWPKNMNQFPINPEDDHLYSFGFGLSY